MRKILAGIVASLCIVLLVCSSGYAQQKMGTPAEAKALVKKAVAYYKSVGKEKAFAEYNKPDGQFSNLKKGLYITVYDFNGKCLASGAIKAMIGKDLIDLKDVDGLPIIRKGLEICRTKGSGWLHYKWANPANKKITKKTTYVELLDNSYMIACGAYSH